ncbi:MAG: hypothetical protein LBS03_09905 [Bacteroidales bacterium]|jgi:hypothetical protein|nr:hypothetical protein [Bacteroidales bacterium]
MKSRKIPYSYVPLERRRSAAFHGLATVCLLLAAHTLQGQIYPPQTLSVNNKSGYYRHGSNSTDPAVTNLPQEVRDSVTVTSKMAYFVLPNKELNPDWYNSDGSIKDIDNTSNLKSSFDWTVKNGYGVLDGTTNTSSGNSASPSIWLEWKTVGIDTLKFKEKPGTSTNSCVAANTAMPVAIIAKPTFAFGAGPGTTAYKDGQCYSQAEVTAGVSYAFPISTTTSSSQLQVSFNVKYTPIVGASSTVSKPNKPLGDLAAEKFYQYGEYEITVTKITDRVSRKSEVDGIITSSAQTFTYTVIEPANTGPIYRIPNKY